MIRWHRRWRHDDFRAERFEQPHFLLRHLVRHGENALVALASRGEGEPDAGVSARPFDDRSAWLESSLSLCLLDDRPTDSIFDRSARVEEFSLRVHGCAN